MDGETTGGGRPPARGRQERDADEATYRALVENLPAVIYQVAPDDDRRTMYVSRHVESALGYSREEWLDQPDIWMELLHPDDREPTLAAHDLHNETGRPWRREYRLIASDGREVWFRDEAILVRDEDRRPHHWLGIQLDITELKRVEEQLRAARDELEERVDARTAELAEANALMALEIGERRRAEGELREAEQRYRLLAEQIPAVTYVWEVNHPDGQTRQDYTSPRIEQVLGFSADEWNSTPDFWMSRLHPHDRTAVLAQTLRVETTGEAFAMEYRYLHKDGRVVWVADHAGLLSRDVLGRPHLFQGVMIDVTERKRAEATIAESELRFRDLAEQVPGIIYIAEFEPPSGYHFTYVSPQIRPILGYEPDIWSQATWLAAVHPDDRERAHIIDWGSVGSGFEMEYRILRRDGEVRWVHDRAHVLSWDVSGRPAQFQGLLTDVTEARRLDLDRRTAEERYRALVEALPAITYVEHTSPLAPEETHYAYVSPQIESILGYTPEEATMDPNFLERTVHPEDRDRIREANARAERSGEMFDEEFRQLTKDGRTRWMHDRAVLVHDELGEPMFWHGVSIDITDRKVAESDLQMLQARYHELAGGMTRDPGADG